MTKTLEDCQYIAAAQRMHQSDVQRRFVDDVADVTLVPDRKGAWVAAIVWVPNEEAAKEPTSE